MNRKKVVVQVRLYKKDLRMLQVAGQVESKSLGSQICSAVHEYTQCTLKRNPKIAEQAKFNDARLSSLFSNKVEDKKEQTTPAKVLNYHKK